MQHANYVKHKLVFGAKGRMVLTNTNMHHQARATLVLRQSPRARPGTRMHFGHGGALLFKTNCLNLHRSYLMRRCVQLT